jgi:trimeric autotransporter adhesin
MHFSIGRHPSSVHATGWLLVLVLATGQPFALAASDYFGQVTFNGLPVPGATVTATPREAGGAGVAGTKASATTDQDGIYHLADLVDGIWTLTIEMLGFEPITREITVPAEKEPAPDALAVRSFDELAREIAAPRPDRVITDVRDQPPVDLSVLIGPTGMGAADGLLINGSLNNGASTPFAIPRAIGNNRPRGPSVRTYAAGLQLGNSAWDARPFSLAGPRPSTPSYTDTQALGTFQGPFRLPGVRNPITVALGYQGSSTTNVNTQFTRVPTDRERAGDLSQTFDALGQPVRIVDPATGQLFADNAIPADRISPQALALLAYYPRADSAESGRFNYQAPVVTATRQDSVRSSATYTIRAQNRLNGSASYQRSVADTTSLFGFEDSRVSSGFDTQAGVSLRPSRYVTVDARYQYSRTVAESVPHFANRVNVSGMAGITGNDQDPRNWGPPSLNFASDLAALTSGRYASTTNQSHLWAADISRFRGAHTVAAGVEIRKQLNDVFGQDNPRGSFGFTGAASGSDFADFLLGLPQTSAIGFGNPDKYFRGSSYAAYITDDWRVGPALTLNVGLRWEYETPVTEARGRLVNLDVSSDVSAVSAVLAGETGPLTGMQFSDALVRADKSGFQPRLGVAWRPVPGSSLVVRAGYGVYRSTNVYQSIAALLAAQSPFSTTFNVASDPSAPLTLANGFRVMPGATLNTFAVDPDFRPASAHNWQASVQQDLPAQLTVTATYLGTRGTNLMQQFLPNTYAPGAVDPCPACPAGFRYLVSSGRSSRHAGQVQIRRRLSAGFTAATEYTLAKAMDNAGAFAGATLDGGALAQNWLDLEAEYARSNFDQRHLVTASVEYTTGSGTSGGTLIDGWKGRLLKDWTFTANVSSGSGLPLTPVYFAPVGGTGIVGSLRPDITRIANDPAEGSYANRAAFSVPAPGQWGNAPRNSLTGPATFAMNAAIARTFRIGNRLNLDWRIDATNVLNHVTYGAVNTLITSPQFGLPNRANDMRRLRSSIRVRF